MKKRKRGHKENFSALFQIAEAQQGLFTAKQAVQAGFVEYNHPYHVRKQNWIREARGVYRLSNFPVNDEAQYALWSLWSRNDQGIPQGVFSHETALRIHGLTDVMPAKLHMTVPQNFRRSVKPPRVLVIHKLSLEPTDVQDLRGYRVTTPFKTILTLADAGVADEILAQAISQSLERGLIPRQQGAALWRQLGARGVAIKRAMRKRAA